MFLPEKKLCSVIQTSTVLADKGYFLILFKIECHPFKTKIMHFTCVLLQKTC